MCVQDIDVQCVLQFTLIHAAGCALHRRTSRVIHRLELWIRCSLSTQPGQLSGRVRAWRLRSQTRRSIVTVWFCAAVARPSQERARDRKTARALPTSQDDDERAEAVAEETAFEPPSQTGEPCGFSRSHRVPSAFHDSLNLAPTRGATPSSAQRRRSTDRYLDGRFRTDCLRVASRAQHGGRVVDG